MDGSLITFSTTCPVNYETMSEAHGHSSNLWKWIAGIIGGLIALLCIAFIVYKCCCKINSVPVKDQKEDSVHVDKYSTNGYFIEEMM